MNFFYEATDNSGQTVMGRLDAGSEAEVRQRLLQMGYRPQAIALNAAAPPQQLANAPAHHVTRVMPAGLAAREVAQSPVQAGARSGGIILSGNAARTTTSATQAVGATTTGRHAPPAHVSQLGGVNDRDRLFFFQQLAALVKSGMSIYMALDNLAPRTPNRNLSRVGLEMAAAARTGGRVSDVMDRYPRIFEENIAGLVRAGELGGFLPEALSEIALNYEQNLALYKGAWLPKIMAIQGLYGLVLAIPLFPDVIGHANLDTGIGPGVRLYAMHEAILLPLAFLIIQGTKWGWAHLQLPGMRRFRDGLTLKLPPYGDLHRQAALSAFVRMLRRLYHAGINPAAAWEGAMQTASNVVIRDRLADSYAMVQRGTPIPDAFAATGLFNDNMEQILITGHHSGQMVESLDQIAEYYDERVAEAADRARRAIAWAGRMAMLVLAGITAVWLTKSCYEAQFKWVNDSFGQ
ncbi:MAG TPA: type II secretion system F family protein [Chthonomonadaceae bacterium]|nr:type II secretion system F family protein [Chthonomonadaceae bacterium]